MADAPLIVAATGSRAWWSPEIATRALVHASGGRTDVLLRVGDCPTGGDTILRTAAYGLGWPRPEIFRANWRLLGKAAGPERNGRLVAAEPKADRGVALFAAGFPNKGTLDCAARLVISGVPLDCWCDAIECASKTEPTTGPCEDHSIPQVLGGWYERTRMVLG